MMLSSSFARLIWKFSDMRTFFDAIEGLNDYMISTKLCSTFLPYSRLSSSKWSFIWSTAETPGKYFKSPRLNFSHISSMDCSLALSSSRSKVRFLSLPSLWVFVPSDRCLSDRSTAAWKGRTSKEPRGFRPELWFDPGSSSLIKGVV